MDVNDFPEPLFRQASEILLAALHRRRPLIVESTRYEDQQLAMDAKFVDDLGDYRIMFRGRSHKYLKQYGNEFTIRCRGKRGSRNVEWQKVKDEVTDPFRGAATRFYQMYFFRSPCMTKIAAYHVIDITALFTLIVTGQVEIPFAMNNKGKHDLSQFRVFNIDRLRATGTASKVVIASAAVESDPVASAVA